MTALGLRHAAFFVASNATLHGVSLVPSDIVPCAVAGAVPCSRAVMKKGAAHMASRYGSRSAFMHGNDTNCHLRVPSGIQSSKNSCVSPQVTYTDSCPDSEIPATPAFTSPATPDAPCWAVNSWGTVSNPDSYTEAKS